MSRFAEITSLFAALASNLQTEDPTALNEVDLSISDLNRSLNLSEAPRVRILETALSLMCFTAPQVYDSVIEFTVKTIVTVLSSSVECKVLRTNKERVLWVGGLVSRSDCANVMERCADILGKLEGRKDDLCALLLYAVIRVAALAPCFPRPIRSTPNLEMKFSDSSTSALANLRCHLLDEVKVKDGEVPLSKDEFHKLFKITLQDGVEIQSNLPCTFPSMFVETRALLHGWFLMTGLASVMELQIEFVGQVLDVISRPMWWGISMEVGSKLPFSHAYFPQEYHLLRILAGPISEEYFQNLIDKISAVCSHTGVHSVTSLKKAPSKINKVDHKSMWAMVMNFPGWFFFASMLLFCDNIPVDSFHFRSIPGSIKHYLMHDTEVSSSTAAANVIAWILNPISESDQYLMVDHLVKVSELWTLKCSSLSESNDIKRVHMKETSRLKLHDKDGITSPELVDGWTVWLWLKEFRDMYIKVFGKGFHHTTSSTIRFSIHQNMLLRRIPLGILLVYANHLNAAGCALLLDYAATGNVQKFSDKQNSGLSQKRWKYDLQGDSMTWIEQYTEAEAIAGCKTVFDITDVTERISPSMFETEEDGLNFVCQLKLKSGNYLLKCMKRLLQVKFDGDGLQMQRDLRTRVIRWRHQGKDVFQNNDLDYGGLAIVWGSGEILVMMRILYLYLGDTLFVQTGCSFET
ncbi:hypothetical protein Sango_1528900 [Sesamum angolense]|uniref:Uncharacterized protein n=1 Tax=Sesamum angolense TaxID=2727404 RepID=A0AAE1WNQ5_9LAMI|nr:hypothetical protein Sango_1528900 [Sesamum angolense]